MSDREISESSRYSRALDLDIAPKDIEVRHAMLHAIRASLRLTARVASNLNGNGNKDGADHNYELKTKRDRKPSRQAGHVESEHESE